MALQNFLAEALNTYGIEAVHPDDFIIQQFDLNPGKVLEAAKNQKDSLRNPTMTFKEYLTALENQVASDS